MARLQPLVFLAHRCLGEIHLLEVLAENQITIPELGTVRAEAPPFTLITSNRTREVHDALKRRCLYHWVEFPDVERELQIVRLKAPGASERLVRQVVELEDGSRWFTQARTVSPQGGRVGQVRAQFAIGLGLDASLAAPLAASHGFDLRQGHATPIGLGCTTCTRADCPQRAAPPASRALVFNERERGVSPFVFAWD